MPVPDPVLYPIAPEVDEAAISRWIQGTEPDGPAKWSDRTLLDTFDGRLQRQGLTLWREGRSPSWTLRLQTGSVLSPPVAFASARGDRLLAPDLPDGVLGERVRTAIAERALVPVVRVRLRSRPLKVCNADGKTVVRLALEEAVLVRGPRRENLGRRLTATPVLGYQRDFERVTGALRRRLPGSVPSVPDAAIAAAGLPPGGVSSDVAVALRPAMRADRATAAICRRLAEVVDANLPGTVADIDPEFLHDLRVAVRRSRSVLKEMRGVLAPDDAARAGADLRWIQEVTGPTRDLDVLLLEWPSMAAPVPPAMAGDLKPLVELLRTERAAAFDEMRRHLRSRRFKSAWDAWRTTIDRARFDGPDAHRPIGRMAGRRIVAVYGSMLRMGSSIDDRSPPAALHDLRKRGKELRYLLELFGGMWPSERVKPLVGALKGLQDVLGHFQDDEIQVHELRSLGPVLAGAPGGTDSLIALGFVIEELTQRQIHSRHDFARRFEEFSRPANRRLVERTFR